MTTYRVKPNTMCGECRIAKRCALTGIRIRDIYQNIVTKKLYALIGDGCECFGLIEVEPEKGGANG